MAENPQNIAKNTTWLTSAYIFQKIFAFIYFTLIARWLGATDIGVYTFAISLTTLMAIFIDFGLSNVLIREAAKYKDKANDYLNNIISLKLLFSVITYILVVIIINLLNKSHISLIMVYLAGIAMVFDSFTLSFWAIFRAYQNLKYEAISIVINQILISIVGIIGLLLKFPLYILIIALVCGSLFSFLYSLILLKTKLKFIFKLDWNKQVIKFLFYIAVPFALAGIFARVYSYIDQILLSVLIGDKYLGWYEIGYKITFALQFVPAAFAAAVYPAMSHSFVNDKERLKIIFEKSIFLLLIFSVPAAAGIALLSDQIILLLYTSEFQPSILAMQIIIFSIIAMFLNYPIGSLLNSCDKQIVNTINVGIAMLLNIILNIILIPLYQHIGAAIACLICQFLLFILNLIWVPKIINYNWKYLLIKTLKTIFSAILMSIAVIYLKTYLNFIIVAIIGALLYGSIMYLIKGFTKEDIIYLVQAIFKKTPYEKELIDNN
ncbi:flippase [Candidatus Falkowbacteria bacterium]|nr:flippase [Candidatus Falkowbacteria bacterium]